MQHTSQDHLADFGLALRRGDVALWLGPEFHGPDDQVELTLLADANWVGIWSETRDPRLGSYLASVSGGGTRPRVTVEVVDLIEDVLGANFSFAEICPYFYINGKEGVRDSLGKGRRRYSGEGKTQKLSEIGASILLIAGYSDPAELREQIADLADRAPKVRQFVVAECTEVHQSALELLPEVLRAKLRWSSLNLVRLLRELEQRQVEVSEEPALRVGSQRVPLAPFLQAQSPIDEDFILLTQRDVADARANEDERSLLEGLLGGGQPAWRAIAHGLAWQRPDHDVVNRVLSRLNELETGEPRIVCIDLPAESGSGLTVLLQQVAFAAANLGFPTLVHRGQGSGIDYDRLRTFLTDLYQELTSENQRRATLLVLDAPSVVGDAVETIKDMPSRLYRDGRRVVIVRGLPLRDGQKVDEFFRRAHGVSRPRLVEHDAPLRALRAALSQRDQESLVVWASDRLSRLNCPVTEEALNVIRRWHEGAEDVPLLICLHFILSGELRDAARLGSHLVSRVRKQFHRGADVRSKLNDTDNTNRTLSISEALALLKDFGRGRAPSLQPEAEDAAAILIALSALGWLRLAVPRDVLADVAVVSPNLLLPVLLELERCDLISTNQKSDQERDGRLAAAAYYSRDETVGLRHPVYGRLIFDWLASPEAHDDRKYMDGHGLLTRFLAELPKASREVPLELLRPILESLKPTTMRGHVQFAEELALRYLRVQKKDIGGSQSEGSLDHYLMRFKWTHRDEIRNIFAAMPDSVVQQSSVLLHSRGITRYKTCRLDPPRGIDIAECRRRYAESETDFQRAEDLARKTQSGEHPANVITSLGHLYLGWAALERECGNAEEWRRLDPLIAATFRKGIQERRINPAAAIGLAEYLVERARGEMRGDAAWKHKDSDEQTAMNLAEAVELLSVEPEPSYADEWNRLKVDCVNLLKESDAQRLVSKLKQGHDELGYVLDALLILDGNIPREPMDPEVSAVELRHASDALSKADADIRIKRCSLGHLLRYAFFSFAPERTKSPAYNQRFDLIQRLKDSQYLEQPIWLWDYAMLCAQTRHFREASEAFGRLRQGQRFFEIPRERSVLLTEGPDSKTAQRFTMRIVSVGADGKGWARVDHPVSYPAPVPFSVRAFQSRGKDCRTGGTPTCFISLNPAGPFAEPTDR